MADVQPDIFYYWNATVTQPATFTFKIGSDTCGEFEAGALQKIGLNCVSMTGLEVGPLKFKSDAEHPLPAAVQDEKRMGKFISKYLVRAHNTNFKTFYSALTREKPLMKADT
jgi:hypothetical protein